MPLVTGRSGGPGRDRIALAGAAALTAFAVAGIAANARDGADRASDVLAERAAPVLLAAQPADQATCVATTRGLSLRFASPMRRAATLAAVSVTPAVSGQWRWNDDATQLSLEPAAPLAESTTYRVTLAQGAADAAGTALAGTPAAVTFTTAGGAYVPGSYPCLLSWLAGGWTNDRQLGEKTPKARPDLRRVRMGMARIWRDGPPAPAGTWLYVEQAVVPDDAQSARLPYRQRLYRIAALPDGSFESRVHSFRDRPVQLPRVDFERVLARLAPADRDFLSAVYAPHRADASLLALQPEAEAAGAARVRALFSAGGWNGGRNRDPLEFAGAWEQPHKLAALGSLTPDDFEERAGCAVSLRWNGVDAFAGGTTGRDCISAWGGATRVTSEVTVGEASLVTWDRGYDASGRQVWGGDERYVFDKFLHLPVE